MSIGNLLSLQKLFYFSATLPDLWDRNYWTLLASSPIHRSSFGFVFFSVTFLPLGRIVEAYFGSPMLLSLMVGGFAFAKIFQAYGWALEEQMSTLLPALPPNTLSAFMDVHLFQISQAVNHPIVSITGTFLLFDVKTLFKMLYMLLLALLP
jgi:hypothetical protein